MTPIERNIRLVMISIFNEMEDEIVDLQEIRWNFEFTHKTLHLFISHKPHGMQHIRTVYHTRYFGLGMTHWEYIVYLSEIFRILNIEDLPVGIKPQRMIGNPLDYILDSDIPWECIAHFQFENIPKCSTTKDFYWMP